MNIQTLVLLLDHQMRSTQFSLYLDESLTKLIRNEIDIFKVGIVIVPSKESELTGGLTMVMTATPSSGPTSKRVCPLLPIGCDSKIQK